MFHLDLIQTKNDCPEPHGPNFGAFHVIESQDSTLTTAGTGTAWLSGCGWVPRFKQVMKLTRSQRGKLRSKRRKSPHR